jgi:ubiquinone/menaquinone biosynthesis C-methylase UbiE
MWTDILRCPKTGNRLCIDQTSSIARVDRADATYSLVDGIVDFCPESQDRIAASYDKVAKRYDPGITASTLRSKVLGRIIWGRASDLDPMEKVLSLLPSRFDGVLLDVPVGTGVFTAPLYRRYPNATIICVDCSMNMLRRARVRFQEHGVNNVHLVKADAARLPIDDAAIDMVLSMNGWHAFADKWRAVLEIRRVFRKDGTFIACGYIKGARRLSDWFVRRFGVRNGYFTPPFFAFDDMDARFKGFQITRRACDKSLAWFEAIAEPAQSGTAF